MQHIRRISAVIMLVCLVLPQRACVYSQRTVEYYPLSDVEGLWAIVVLACYALPLAALILLRHWPIADAVTGIVIALFGLWQQGFGALQSSSYVLAGWYLYVASTTLFLITSLVQLRVTIVRRRMHQLQSESSL